MHDMLNVNIDEARKQQIAFVTRLFINKSRLSFLRLGDGELRMLLDFQSGRKIRFHYRSDQDQMRLKESDLARLLEAYENCDFLDTYECLEFNKTFFPSLKFRPKPEQLHCLTPKTTQIIFEWTMADFKVLQESKKILIAGAEAPLLCELMSDSSFRNAAQDVLPSDKNLYFVALPRDGEGYWERIDDTKNYLRKKLATYGADVLLLSLSSAAKMICVDLAEEEGILAVDFGATLRGLCGTATSGVSSALSSHFPYFYDVPLETYIKALQRAYPKMPKRDFVRKINRQVILSLVPRYSGVSGPLRFLPAHQITVSEHAIKKVKSDLSFVFKYHLMQSATVRTFALADLIGLLGHFRTHRVILRDRGMIDNLILKLNHHLGFAL